MMSKRKGIIIVTIQKCLNCNELWMSGFQLCVPGMKYLVLASERFGF